MNHILKTSAIIATALVCLVLSSETTSAGGGIPTPEESIVYQCRGDQNAGGGFDICRVNPDGTGYQRLTHDSIEDSAPRISPDGGLIVWRRDITDLWIMDSDGANQRQLLPEIISQFGPPTWSPDGQTIAVICSDPDNPNVDVICLTEKDGSRFDLSFVLDPRPSYIEWSPSDPNLILVEQANGSNEDIKILNMTNGALTNITNTPDDYEQGTWSPDGSQIAFVGSPLPADGVSLVSLYTIDPDGTDRELLFTSDWSAPATGPAWSPRGDEIAYFCSHTDVGDPEVCFVDPDTGALNNLLQEGVADQYYLGKSPDWGFTAGPIFGDMDCDGDDDDDDLLLLLEASYDAETSQPCASLAGNVEVNGVARPFGDLDCNGSFDALDALPMLLSSAGLPETYPGCPVVGHVANIIQV